MSKINEWAYKTLELASNGNYLDRLLEIYPAVLPPTRPLPNNIKESIRNLYREKKYEELVTLLIKLKDESYPFPIEHPYASLLRHLRKRIRESVIKRNPMVIKELADLIISLGLNNIIRGVERPKDINRTLGTTFKNWVRRKFTKAPFKIVNDYILLLNCGNDEICIYAGRDEQIAEFIRRYLDLKEPEDGFFDRDIIVNVKNFYIIGEARFLSTPGGSQNRDLDNTLRFVEVMEKITTNIKPVIGIALLDGVVWFHNPYINQIKQRAIGNRIVMSAVFLEEFLLDLFNKLP